MSYPKSEARRTREPTITDTRPFTTITRPIVTDKFLGLIRRIENAHLMRSRSGRPARNPWLPDLDGPAQDSDDLHRRLAVAMPRAFSALAIARNEVAPLAATRAAIAGATASLGSVWQWRNTDAVSNVPT